MQSLLLIGNAKRLSDTFVNVDALIERKSADRVESVYEELEYVLNLVV
jgi:shikimate kinase